jgi:hypothetical protein
MEGYMSRIRTLAALAVIAALALASVAMAAPAKPSKPSKITGGSTTLTISSAVATALKNNHLTLAPIAPATASGNTFTFPISGGRLNAKLHGYVVQKGGFSISNGTRTVRVRHLVIYAGKKMTSVYALVSRKAKRHCRAGVRTHHLVCKTTVKWVGARIGKVTGVTFNGTTATGDVELTAASAKVLNRLAGKKIATAGVQIGTATAKPTF